jgi:hypothetical protein
MFGRWPILGACVLGYALGAGCLGLGALLLEQAIIVPDGASRLVTMGLGALCIGSALYLFVTIPSAVSCKRRPDLEERVRERAARLGLPTDPAAYADGGLAVAATVARLEEADVLVAVLRGAEIPAWVEGSAAGSWLWHMQFGLHPSGVRVLVPTGRLADAQRVLAEQREPGGRPEDRAPGEAEPADYALYRRARGLAYLLLIGILAPVVFVLALRLLQDIRRQRAGTGESEYLRRAHRLALIVSLISVPIWGVLVGVVGVPAIEVARSLVLNTSARLGQ